MIGSAEVAKGYQLMILDRVKPTTAFYVQHLMHGLLAQLWTYADGFLVVLGDCLAQWCLDPLVRSGEE